MPPPIDGGIVHHMAKPITTPRHQPPTPPYTFAQLGMRARSSAEGHREWLAVCGKIGVRVTTAATDGRLIRMEFGIWDDSDWYWRPWSIPVPDRAAAVAEAAAFLGALGYVHTYAQPTR